MNRQQETFNWMMMRLAAVTNKQHELQRRVIKLQRRSRKLLKWSGFLSGGNYAQGTG